MSPPNQLRSPRSNLSATCCRRCAQAPTAHELSSLVPAGKTSRWGVYPHDVLAQARFWSAYKTFCAGNGSEDGKSPLQYEGRVIDLYVLHTVVADLGGAEAVSLRA